MSSQAVYQKSGSTTAKVLRSIMVMMDKDMDSKIKRGMMEQIDEVDGVKWSISMSSLFGPAIPDSQGQTS